MDRYSTQSPGDSLKRLERRLRWYRGISLLGLASLLAAACAAMIPGSFRVGDVSPVPRVRRASDPAGCKCCAKTPRPSTSPEKLKDPLDADLGPHAGGLAAPAPRALHSVDSSSPSEARGGRNSGHGTEPADERRGALLEPPPTEKTRGTATPGDELP